MKSFSNTKKLAFLSEIPKCSLDREDDTLTKRCKFNFSYFTKQPSSQEYGDWTKEQLVKDGLNNPPNPRDFAA